MARLRLAWCSERWTSHTTKAPTGRVRKFATAGLVGTTKVRVILKNVDGPLIVNGLDFKHGFEICTQKFNCSDYRSARGWMNTNVISYSAQGDYIDLDTMGHEVWGVRYEWLLETCRPLHSPIQLHGVCQKSSPSTIPEVVLLSTD